MLLPEPKGHLALTFSFVWTIVVSNIITVAVCLLFLNQLAKITYVRGSILIPLILMLIYLGAFAEKNAFQDLVLVLIFGVLGWVMARLSWPRPPLILGLVLGPLAENRLFLSMELYGLDWVLRPGVLLLIALTLAGLFYPALSARRRRAGAKERGRTSTKGAINSPGKNALRFSWSAVFGLVIIGTFILALVQSTTFAFRAGLFPWTIGSLILALALVQFIKDLFVGVKAQNSEGQWMEAATELPGPVVRRRTAEVFGWIIGCFLAIWFFGFSIGVPLFTFVKLKIHAREKLPLALALTAFSWALVYGLFDFVLKVPFPTGQLFRWL
jgi:hypothetical protein